MIQYVASLVDLAPLDRGRFPGVFFHGCREGLAAVQNIEPRYREIQPAIQQIAEQFADYRGVFRGAFRIPKIIFFPSTVMPKNSQLYSRAGCITLAGVFQVNV
jgi:hypothetical protein